MVDIIQAGVESSFSRPYIWQTRIFKFNQGLRPYDPSRGSASGLRWGPSGPQTPGMVSWAHRRRGGMVICWDLLLWRPFRRQRR